jgi:hypothetical protein
MFKSWKLARCGAIAVIAVGSPILLAARPPIASSRAEPACKVLATWAQNHSRELPTTYAEIGRYPLGYRRAIQGVLPLATRREMWQTQLRLYRDALSLTSDQQAFLDNARKVLDEILSEGTSKDRLQPVGDSLLKAAQAVLGKELALRVFTVLGPVTDNLSQDPMRHVFDGVISPSPAAVPAVPFANCNCHQSETELSCLGVTPACTTSQGCGAGGAYSCNGCTNVNCNA